MTNEIQTVEEKISADWNAVRAFVAKNQIASLGIMFAAGWVLGFLHLPV